MPKQKQTKYKKKRERAKDELAVEGRRKTENMYNVQKKIVFKKRRDTKAGRVVKTSQEEDNEKELNQFNGKRIIHTIVRCMRYAHSYYGTWIGNHLNKLFDSFPGHEI